MHQDCGEGVVKCLQPERLSNRRNEKIVAVQCRPRFRIASSRQYPLPPDPSVVCFVVTSRTRSPTDVRSESRRSTFLTHTQAVSTTELHLVEITRLFYFPGNDWKRRTCHDSRCGGNGTTGNTMDHSPAKDVPQMAEQQAPIAELGYQ